jgi:hypothetical protein
MATKATTTMLRIDEKVFHVLAYFEDSKEGLKQAKDLLEELGDRYVDTGQEDNLCILMIQRVVAGKIYDPYVSQHDPFDVVLMWKDLDCEEELLRAELDSDSN